MLSREFRRRFGISAPRVAVRAQVPWYWRYVSIALLMVTAAIVGWWVYDAGRQYAGYNHSETRHEIEQLRNLTDRLTGENESLRTQAAQADGQYKVERAAHDDLARQVKALMDENAKLKEDLAFFHNLTSGGTKEEKLSVHSLKLARDALPGEYRYSLLLVQSGQRVKDFHGKLQFVVKMRQNGDEEVLSLPGEDPQNAAAFKLNFKFYQRIEGRFRAPLDAAVESLQIRIFQDGAAEARIVQSVKLS